MVMRDSQSDAETGSGLHSATVLVRFGERFR
jgi:hypothetical protein